MGTNNSSNYVPVQFNVITGGASGAINNVAPGTSGIPIISQGASSQPIFGTALVAGGGTGATSFTQTNGIVTYNGTTLVNYSGPQISSAGVSTNSSQPAFLVYPSANLTNVTGDGTVYAVILNTAISNQSSSYNTSTGVFTAPVTGIYHFSASISLQGLAIADTSTQASFVATSDTVLFASGNFSTTILSGSYQLNGNAMISMTATDTCYLSVQVSGSTKTVTVGGTRNTTYFSGYLVC